MLTHLRLLMSIFSFMAFTTDPVVDDPEDPPVKDPKDPPVKDPGKNDDKLPDDKSTWTVEQWERHTQSVAAKEKAEGKRVAERAHKDAEADAARAADIAKKESEGEYETAKTQLTADLTTAQAERDQALEILKANIDTQWNEMPESVKSTYKGDEDDVLAKSAYMQQMQPIIAELVEKAKASKAGGNPPNPKAATGKVEVPSAVPKQRMW